MDFWYYIKVEAGQSLNDIALQEYGTDYIEVLNQIIIDNKELLHDGIASLLYAGMELKLRTEYALRNRQIASAFESMPINQHNDTGDENTELTYPEAGSNEVIIEPGESVEVKIASDSAEAVFVNYFFKEYKITSSGTEQDDDGTEQDDDGTEQDDEETEQGDDGTEQDDDGTEQDDDGTEQQKILRYSGSLRIINDFKIPTITDDEYNGESRHHIQLECALSEIYLVLRITAPEDARVYFKKHVITIL